MEKKEYAKPQTSAIELRNTDNILLGSGDSVTAPTATFSDSSDDYISSGYASSKSIFPLWEDFEEEED